MAVTEQATTNEFGERMRAARNARGLSLKDVEFESRQRFPKAMWINLARLQRVETGLVPEDKIDPVEVIQLAAIYKCRISELSPLVAETRELLRDLLERSSTWEAQTAGQSRFDFVAA